MQVCFKVDHHVHWFTNIGFRPVEAKWIKDQHGEMLMPFIATDADVPYDSKYTPQYDPCPADSFGWSDLTAMWPAPDSPISALSTYPRIPAQPFHPAIPGAPGVPVDPVMPPVAPVPLPDAGTMLLAGIVFLMLARPCWNAMGRFADWFTAERGTGPGKCGWP